MDTAGTGKDLGINSYGINFSYLGEPGMESLERVPAWTLGLEHIPLQANSPNGLFQAQAGIVMNLRKSTTHRLELSAQNLLSLGSDLRGFQNITDTFRANSNSFAISMRYLNSKFGGAENR